jgi:hypothetical protein
MSPLMLSIAVPRFIQSSIRDDWNGGRFSSRTQAARHHQRFGTVTEAGRQRDELHELAGSFGDALAASIWLEKVTGAAASDYYRFVSLVTKVSCC